MGMTACAICAFPLTTGYTEEFVKIDDGLKVQFKRLTASEIITMQHNASKALQKKIYLFRDWQDKEIEKIMRKMYVEMVDNNKAAA